MNLTSENLKVTQNVLEQMIKEEIDSPDTNFCKVRALVNVTDDVDTERREAWHDEQFGPYEEAVDELLTEEDLDKDAEQTFDADDIPF